MHTTRNGELTLNFLKIALILFTFSASYAHILSTYLPFREQWHLDAQYNMRHRGRHSPFSELRSAVNRGKRRNAKTVFGD